MPTEIDILIRRVSRSADAITDAIDDRAGRVDRSVLNAQRVLLDRVVNFLLSNLTFRDGVVENSVRNLALVSRVDEIFLAWERETMPGVLVGLVDGLFAVTAMTGKMYDGMGALATIQGITENNAAIRAAIGIDEAGRVVRGSALYELSAAAPVRTGLKDVVLRAVQTGTSLRDFQGIVRLYMQGNRQATGRLQSYWRTYTYDLFNQVQEAKNQQFAEDLELDWFLYVGDIISDSRDFCRKKAGKIFAVVEAKNEWPKDRDLPGKKSGIPYRPLLDRGRWNCRHRIRYITEEMARQIDEKKVDAIKKRYGS